MNNKRAEEIENYKNELRDLLEQGNYQVYGIVRHVSASGMSRVIDFCTIIDNEPIWLSYRMGEVLDYKRHKSYDGLTVGGCGMDMIFHTICQLSVALYCPKKYDHDQAYKLKSSQL